MLLELRSWSVKYQPWELVAFEIYSISQTVCTIYSVVYWVNCANCLGHTVYIRPLCAPTWKRVFLNEIWKESCQAKYLKYIDNFFLLQESTSLLLTVAWHYFYKHFAIGFIIYFALFQFHFNGLYDSTSTLLLKRDDTVAAPEHAVSLLPNKLEDEPMLDTSTLQWNTVVHTTTEVTTKTLDDTTEITTENGGGKENTTHSVVPF